MVSRILGYSDGAGEGHGRTRTVFDGVKFTRPPAFVRRFSESRKTTAEPKSRFVSLKFPTITNIEVIILHRAAFSA
ncbi:hypothetical protein H6P81_015815 [Aristolochia fimbriata]|uniref:Uncharacterized protein n=1 Tax=Aristolochia fimbriata TaxID=158543 RepID=A0AAV7E8P9_ARIFI|nr:hypothetical protein H6P81_015815 [Aristolochia fimbriata]